MNKQGLDEAAPARSGNSDVLSLTDEELALAAERIFLEMDKFEEQPQIHGWQEVEA
jgi:hypothetical protein